MKAVIVEIKEQKAAVLLEDGRIEKIKNSHFTIGEVIEMKEKGLKISWNKKLVAGLSSAATFLILVGVGAWSYYTPYSYVSLDVNPSIEYTVNRYDQVLSVNAVNDDGQDILEEIGLTDLENVSIEEAIEQTIDQISAEGYFDSETEGGLVISTYGENEENAEELAAELEEVAEEVVEENGDEVTVEVLSAGQQMVQMARELGVTPGKLNIVQKLVESSETPGEVSVEEWLQKPVKDIMKAIKENKKALKNQLPESTDEIQEEESQSDVMQSEETQQIEETESVMQLEEGQAQTNQKVKEEQKQNKKAENSKANKKQP